MSTTTSTPYSWLRKIPSSLLELDEIPLLGSPPPFAFEGFTAHLAKTLELQDLKIEPLQFQWRTPEQLFSGMGQPLAAINLSIPPLEGTCCFAMSEDDIQPIMQIMLLKGAPGIKALQKEYQDPFYTFLALEAINAFNQSGYEQKFSPKLIRPAQLPSTSMLCLDVSISLGGQKINGRLFISPQLRQSIKEYYAQRGESAPFTSPIANSLELTVHLEAGSTAISLREWSQVKPGDFLLLDRCTLNPEEDKQRIVLTLGGQPIYRGKIKDGSIKILENPFYHEDTQAMKHEDEEEYEDEEFEEEEYEEEEEEEEGEYEEEGNFEEEEEEEAVKEEDTKPAVPTKVAATPVEAPATSPKDIPLSVVVEVGRIKMTVQALMDLQPGNLLDLNVKPEDGVDLVVNGSRVAKGELLQIGEALGVRILDLK